MPKRHEGYSFDETWTHIAKPRILFDIYFLEYQENSCILQNERGFADDLYVAITLSIFLEYEQ